MEEDNKYNEVHIDTDVVCEICGEVFGELSEDRQALIESDVIILQSEIRGTTFLDDVRKVAELHLLDDEDFTALQELLASEGSEAAWRQFHEESGGMEEKQLRGIALLVLARKLSGYPTRLEEDQVWVKDNEGEGYTRKRLAVELRMAEKLILLNWIKHIKGESQAPSAKVKPSTSKKAKKRKLK